MSPKLISRREIYDRLWARPATKVASELGISCADLLKVCEQHDIPRPLSGHWSKVAWGKPFDRPPLPTAQEPELAQIAISPRPSAPEIPLTIAVPNRLSSPHPLVLAALNMLESETGKSDQIVFSGGPAAVRIVVTRENVGRAIRIMDAFVKEMEKNGFELQPRGNYSHAEVVMRKAEIQYPIKLREHLQRTALPLTPKQQDELRKWGHCFGDRYKHTPDGKLIFTFGEDYWPTICQDTTKKTLKDKLGAFIARILRKVGEDEQRARQRAEENLARERALAEQRKREEEAARLKQEEQDRINALKDEISRWRLSRDIHTYVQEMKDLVSSGNAKITDGGPMDRWLEWAEHYAEKIDPLAPLRGELRKIGQSTVKKAETAT